MNIKLYMLLMLLQTYTKFGDWQKRFLYLTIIFNNYHMFSISTYVMRRAQLMERVKTGLLLFPGNQESSMNYLDNTYRFRQDSTFLYYFGFHDRSGLTAVIDADAGTSTVYGEDLTIDDIVWTGPMPTIKEQAARAGITYTGTTKELVNTLSEAIKKGRKIHYLPSYRPEHTLKYYHWLGIEPQAQNERISLDLVRAVVDQRNIKTDEEIVLLDKAAAISMDMHVAGMKAVQPGMKEYEIAAIMHKTALENNCQLAFPIICSVRGETLHNHYHGNTMEAGQMLLMDAGAELPQGYCGDISSTVPVSGTFTPRQQLIYDIVEASHIAAVEELRPGKSFKEIYYTSCRTIVEGLKDLGLMKGNTEEAVQEGAHALFFPCGLGHMMGLDVHDMENLGEVWVGYDGEPKSTQFGIKSLRLGRPLEPGFVLTIEPGIYFIPSLIDLWASKKHLDSFINYARVMEWKDFSGIRNEEDYVITAEGKRLLGKREEKDRLCAGYRSL